MASNPRNRINTAVRAQLQVFCYEQRLRGVSIRNIAALATAQFERNVSKSTVGELIDTEIKDRVQPAADAVRTMELDKLDALEIRLNDQLDEAQERKDDAKTAALANSLLRAYERRARLQGMDAPTQFTSDTTVHYTIEGVDPALLQ